MKTVLIKKILNFISDLTKSRIFVIGAFFAFLFALLIHKVFVLQVIEGESYLESFTYRIQKETELPSSRGTIYDRNGKILAYNRLANSVTIEDSSLLKTNAELDKYSHLYEKNKMSRIFCFFQHNLWKKGVSRKIMQVIWG